MAVKLTEAQVTTLARGAQRDDGLLSPAPKTPPHMALAMATKLADAGLVERVDVPMLHSCSYAGHRHGYRVTPAGFTALGIAAEEWPSYAQSAMDDVLGDAQEPTP